MYSAPPTTTPPHLETVIGAVFHEIADAVVVADARCCIAQVNPALERTFGYTQAELRGRSASVLYENESASPSPQELHSGSAAAAMRPFLARFRRRDGSVFAGEAVSGTMRDADGGFAGSVAIVRDISSRVHAQQQAAANLERLTDALEALDEGFSLWDRDDRLVLCNAPYRAMYPVSAPHMVPGAHFEELVRYAVESGEFDVPEAEREAWLRERVRRHRAPPSQPFEQRHRDGRWLLVSEHRTRDGGVAGIRMDISTRKRAELALARLSAIGSRPGVSIDHKMQELLELGCAHFELPVGALSVLEDDSLTVRHAVSPVDGLAPGVSYPVQGTPCGHTLASGAVVDLTGKQADVAPSFEHLGMGAYLGAPFMVNGRAHGTVCFFGAARSQPFAESDQELLRLIARWVGHEVERQDAQDELERTRAELERLAAIDELTGLLNRRAVFEFGNGEFARARRYAQPMCVLVLDLDHFKRVNDTLGHAAGDRVLKGVAACCRNVVRNVDAVGRLGGEEFTLVLVQTGNETGLEIAERIRAAVNCVFVVPGMRVSASIGVAELDAGDADFEALLARADAALYRAKDDGRNRVYVAPACRTPNVA
jgi:diguanylate cyclase (GGDEF)-like protein/PAS domain S-box-containing protein